MRLGNLAKGKLRGNYTQLEIAMGNCLVVLDHTPSAMCLACTKSLYCCTVLNSQWLGSNLRFLSPGCFTVLHSRTLFTALHYASFSKTYSCLSCYTHTHTHTHCVWTGWMEWNGNGIWLQVAECGDCTARINDMSHDRYPSSLSRGWHTSLTPAALAAVAPPLLMLWVE
jgi:hypothetical protein